MIQEDYRAAIDIGTTKVCTVLGRQRPDGEIEVSGIGVAPCSGLSKGVVTDVQATAAAVRASLADASASSGLTIGSAYVGLSGSHIESVNRWDQVHPTGPVKVITQEDMDAALASVRQLVVSDNGTQLLHVIPRGYALDARHVVRNPLGMHAGELHMNTHVVTGDRESLGRLKAAVEAAGVRVAGLIVEPIASAEAALTADERDEGAVLLDIGGGTTDIAVFLSGQIAHTAVLPVGGWQFSNDLVTALTTSYEEAEELKVTHGSVTPELATMREEITVATLAEGVDGPLTITRRELGQLLKERAQELFKLVRMKLSEFEGGARSTNRVVLTGGGAKLDGMQGLARYIFQGHVRTASPRALDGLPVERQDPAYSAGVGMLIWGLRNLPRGTHLSSARMSAGPGEAAKRAVGALRGWRRRAAKPAEAAVQV